MVLYFSIWPNYSASALPYETQNTKVRCHTHCAHFSWCGCINFTPEVGACIIQLINIERAERSAN